MKVCRKETKKEVINTSYEICDKYCCKTLEEWLTIESNYRHALSWDKKEDRFKITVKDSASSYDSYDDGDTSSVKLDLIYCPFCGEKLQEPKKVAKKKRPWGKK